MAGSFGGFRSDFNREWPWKTERLGTGLWLLTTIILSSQTLRLARVSIFDSLTKQLDVFSLAVVLMGFIAIFLGEFVAVFLIAFKHWTRTREVNVRSVRWFALVNLVLSAVLYARCSPSSVPF